MSLKLYYEKELSSLHEEAQHFAKQYPELAAALNLEKNRSHDPHVERLLEGCAYLTAKIHQMLHEEEHTLPQHLVQRLWPQLNQGFPAVTLIQVQASSDLSAPVVYPRGTRLQSEAIGEFKTTCYFETTLDLTLTPLVLRELVHSKSQGEHLNFVFQRDQDKPWSVALPECLPIYIETTLGKAQALIHFLIASKGQLRASIDDKPLDSSSLRVSFPCLNPGSCLNPQSESGLFPEQLLFEAFIYPEKTQLFEIHGLASLLPFEGESLTLYFSLSEPLDHAYSFSKDDIRLFSVPVINRYTQDCEPIQLDHKHHRYALVADHVRPNSVKVLSIHSVKGQVDPAQPQIEYVSLIQLVNSADPYYAYDSDGYLSFHSRDQNKQIISVSGLLCNENTPRRHLRAGQLSFVEKKSSSIHIESLHQPTAYYPPLFTNQYSEALRLLRVQVEQLDTVEQLTALLKLLIHPSQEGLHNKIQAIKALKISKAARVQRGVFHHVHVLELTFQESGFSSQSDAYVFGALLHTFFQEAAALTTVVQTRILNLPSEHVFSWTGRLE